MLSDDYIEQADGDFSLCIANKRQFETIVRCLNAAVNFRSISRLFVVFGEAIGSLKLGKPTQHDVARSIRHVVAINLTALRTIFGGIWGYAILVDGATHRSDGYFDVRVSFELSGTIYNFHLLAIPMGGRSHTASNYADLVRDVLEDIGGDDVLRKLIGVTSDGAATMLGCRQGFATRIREACASLGGEGVVVSWCGSHQLNLAVDAFLNELDDLVCFRKSLSAEISFTRAFDTVRTAVGECPSYDTTRWESIHDACHFLNANCETLQQLQLEKKGGQLASDSWWLVLFVVTEISESLRLCFKFMQYKTVTMAEQYRALKKLTHVLQMKFESQDNVERHDEPSVSLEKVRRELTCVSFNSSRLFEQLTHDQQEHLVDGVARSIQLLIARIQRIQINVMSEAGQGRPPETPKEVLEHDPIQFRALLELYSSRLKSRFGTTVCNEIWAERNKLIKRYAEDSAFRRRVDGGNDLPFADAWGQLDANVSSSRLLSFIAGLAARTPGTHTVEGDFSSLKQAKSDHRTCLSNYAMEGELQAKQYFELVSLAHRVASQTKVD